MQDSNTARHDTPVTFRYMIRHLADEIGRHHIPVRIQATDIHEFMGPDSIHHELVNKLVRAIYKANRCGHLDAPVHAAETFNALGNVRARLSQSGRADRGSDQPHRRHWLDGERAARPRCRQDFEPQCRAQQTKRGAGTDIAVTARSLLATPSVGADIRVTSVGAASYREDRDNMSLPHP